jgi:hypothetical protein
MTRHERLRESTGGLVVRPFLTVVKIRAPAALYDMRRTCRGGPETHREQAWQHRQQAQADRDKAQQVDRLANQAEPRNSTIATRAEATPAPGSSRVMPALSSQRTTGAVPGQVAKDTRPLRPIPVDRLFQRCAEDVARPARPTTPTLGPTIHCSQTARNSTTPTAAESKIYLRLRILRTSTKS